MSRKKKSEQLPLVEPEVPKHILDLPDDVVIDKKLLLKILSDFARGEKSRYRMQMESVSKLAADVAILKDKIVSSREKSIFTDKMLIERFAAIEAEMDETNIRTMENEANIDEVFTAYNAIEPWAKNKKWDTITKFVAVTDDDKEDRDDADLRYEGEQEEAYQSPSGYQQSEWPPVPRTVNCNLCLSRIDSPANGRLAMGRCANTMSTHFRKEVSGLNDCAYFKNAKLFLDSSEHRSRYLMYDTGSAHYYRDPLKHAPNPIFYAEDISKDIVEEFICQKV